MKRCMMSGEAGWQVDKSLQQCMEHLLKHNEDFNDVTFRLTAAAGKDEGVFEEEVYVPALQTLLLARSPVFAAMFKGSLSNKKDDQLIIDLPDVEPDAFRELLRYIYTDRVELTADNVMSVMYLSKKYFVSGLTGKCTQYLERKMTADTAPMMLEHSLLFDDIDLKKKALAKIEETATAVLSSDEFMKLSHQALNEVLQLNLRIENELQVFQACMRWAERKCGELQQAVDGTTNREVLAESLFLIRFPTMSIDDFSDHVVPHDILTAEEEQQISTFITNNTKNTNNTNNTNNTKKTKNTKKTNNIKKTNKTKKTNNTNRNIKFPTEARISSSQFLSTLDEPSPHSLIFHKFASQYITFSELRSKRFSSCLKGSVSRAIRLTKIVVYAGRSSDQLRVILSQNDEHLHTYDGAATSITAASPCSYCSLHIPGGVIVEEGPLQLDIELSVTNSAKHRQGYTIYYTAPSESCMQDDNLTIQFSPVKRNLLLELGYLPVV